MLMGEYQHNMDQKGRVAIPSKFREELGDVFYLSQGVDNCLLLLSKQEMEALVAKITAMPMAKSKNIRRHFIARSAEVEPDKQGRILIPQQLRDYAGLTKDVTIVGSANQAEIWDTDAWNEYQASQSVESLEEEMEALGF